MQVFVRRSLGGFLVPLALSVFAQNVQSAQNVRSAEAQKLSFNRDIRPILAENCFACHGPDSAARKADLRLDQREVAVKAGAIVPGKPDESEMIHRVFSVDKDEMMPPASLHRQLTPAQREKLKTWIASGAEYQQLWSFIAPVRPALPPVKNSGWVRNPIDRFVLSRLEQEGMQPAAGGRPPHPRPSRQPRFDGAAADAGDR